MSRGDGQDDQATRAAGRDDDQGDRGSQGDQGDQASGGKNDTRVSFWPASMSAGRGIGKHDRQGRWRRGGSIGQLHRGLYRTVTTLAKLATVEVHIEIF